MRQRIYLPQRQLGARAGIRDRSDEPREPLTPEQGWQNLRSALIIFGGAGVLGVTVIKVLGV